jgi:hypothetical protein
MTATDASSSNNGLLSNALSSAAASIISRCFTHPLDTTKAQLQVTLTKNGDGPLRMFQTILQKEGPRGLYRGFSIVVTLGTPGSVLYLCTYEAAKQQFTKNDFTTHFLAGMTAETIACLVYVPVDVVKERMQVQQKQEGAYFYRNGWDALRQISKTEGMAGIYRGYGATLASFGPFSAFYFVFYERAKLWSRQRLTRTTAGSSRDLECVELPFSYTLACSCGSGAAASWLTSPLDLAKLRLQVSRARGTRATAATYRGFVDCLLQTYQQGGVKALFRGAGARVLHFAPATTITMTSYETCRSYMNKILLDV